MEKKDVTDTYLATFSLHPCSICLHGIAAAVELGYEYVLRIHPGYLDAKQNYQEVGGKQEHGEIAVSTYYPSEDLGVVRFGRTP